ncbi:hypothetical protein [Sediminicurvatus halobius]|uniref:Transmembrane cytochrome oxidase associated protein n=1 Tax=Sediminicurvatus halobius TaxID=2182432 RepID=A0A2U2MYT6_9GAMM|nr:hypothetical protein [Spiribacter halobius]PWG61953.1 hypothetical protein DEM34_13905 [Spiribacter halobius]UEX78360.1 hypothetical protein LMH63_01580 [Spiribacter halobius]
MTQPTRRGRWQLLAVLVLFVGPTVAAFVLTVSGWRPGGTTNNGELVQPVQRLAMEGWRDRTGEAPDLDGSWILLVPLAGDCNAECEDRLETLGRVRIALDRDVDRVRIATLQPPDSVPPEADGDALVRLTAPAPRVAALIGNAGQPVAVHLLDYRGFHVLRYRRPLDASGLLDDLERLLRLSKEEAERRASESPDNA